VMASIARLLDHRGEHYRVAVRILEVWRNPVMIGDDPDSSRLATSPAPPRIRNSNITALDKLAWRIVGSRTQALAAKLAARNIKNLSSSDTLVCGIEP